MTKNNLKIVKTEDKKQKELKEKNSFSSLAYLGNVVDLWERLAKEDINIVELGSD